MTGRPGAGRTKTSCYDKAAELLSRRWHFRAELNGKLSRRGYCETEINSVLERLARAGLLDDDRCAAELIRERRRRGAGRRRLAADLARRGLDDEAIARHLEALDPEDELRLARRVAAKWCSSRGSRGLERQALARHLDRKGFGKSVILAILDELNACGGSLPETELTEE